MQAKTLARQGKELMRQQKYAEACTAFENSHRLEPTISTLLDHADCREKNAQLATAWGLFVDSERLTRSKPDAASKRLNIVALERARKLEERLSKISIDVAPDHRLTGLEVLRGSDRVDPSTWNRALPVDGGTYKITTRAPGCVEWTTNVVVKPERDVQTVAIPKLKLATVTRPRPEVTAPSPRTKPASVTPALSAASVHATNAGSIGVKPTGSANHVAKLSLVLPIAMGTVAISLGGATFIYSRRGDSIYADAKREPDDAKQEALWRLAQKRHYAAVGFSAGTVICTGAAIYLFLRVIPEEAPRIVRPLLRLEPTASASSMGLGVRGVW
ncbi:MAG TPA: tetratricopeptide repeat protein [Kofleriaceae bacterium]|nr:tetratricopeptide repeat protein [Kofleriaceae bacterium]